MDRSLCPLDESITFEALENYLLSRGWTMDAQVRNVARVWHTESDQDAEIVVPISHDFKKSRSSLRTAILSLAKVEKRSFKEIETEVKRSSGGSLSIRVIGNDTRDGTIPIRDGADLIAGARDLIKRSMQSTVSKRRVHRGRLPDNYRSYLDSLLLGSPTAGSFIITVIAPNFYEGALKQGDEVGELALRSVVSSFNAASGAIDRFYETKDFAEFDFAVEEGLSSDFCDAILRIAGGVEKGRELEISVNVNSTSLFREPSSSYYLRAQDIELLQQASAHLKSAEVKEDVSVVGLITSLHRGDGQDVGTVRLLGMADEVVRAFSLKLQREDYHVATLAHDSNREVVCRGDIVMSVGSAYIVNVRSFTFASEQWLLDI